MSSPVAFPCTSCGLCCKVGPKLVPGWPLREDGACIHLAHDNTCKIYASRPLVCRVDQMQRLSGSSEREHHEANAEVCNRLQEEAGMDAKYRVQLPPKDF